MVEPMRLSVCGILWVSVALGLSLWPVPAGAQSRTPPAVDPPRDQPREKIMFNPFEDILISARAAGLLWLRNMGPTPETRRNRAPFYRKMYSIQLPGADDAIEVRRTVGVNFDSLGSARPDGSALLAGRGGTQLCVARGDINDDVKWIPIRYPGTDAEVFLRAVYPDGVIVQERPVGVARSSSLSPPWWIPLRDIEPDVKKAVRLSEPPGTVNFGYGDIIFSRHGDQIAWINDTREWDKNPGPPPVPLRLFIFDIAAGKVRSIDTGKHHLAELLAFDGNHAATGYQVIDITNAKVSSMPSYTRVVGISRGALYSVRDAGDTLEVYSAPVGAPTESKLVRRIRRTDLGPDVAPFGGDSIALIEGKRTPNRHPIPIEGIFLAHLREVLWWDGTRWTPLP
jgi:hypothetical protein